MQDTVKQNIGEMKWNRFKNHILTYTEIAVGVFVTYEFIENNWLYFIEGAVCGLLIEFVRRANIAIRLEPDAKTGGRLEQELTDLVQSDVYQSLSQPLPE